MITLIFSHHQLFLQEAAGPQLSPHYQMLRNGSLAQDQDSWAQERSSLAQVPETSTGKDKLYTQMGKVDRLRNIVQPLAALFWALGIVCTCQHLTLPVGPASLHRCTQSMSLYGHSWFNSQ